ncbi:hypothetical protein Tco_0770150 [Tanacetum coccineum]|uniref:Uncharacterized protein n=1 Tax=Tanacetum coccineum TaxID=301880 RepID=A0ABQ4ZBD5_9ASTR
MEEMQFATGEINKLTNGEGTRNREGSGLQYGRLTKFEFPKFYGEDAHGWLYRVNKFFLLESIADNQKVRSMTYPPKTTTTTLALPAPPNSGTNNSEDYGLEELLKEQVVQNFGESIVEAPLISLHAMNGESTYKTIRVKDYVGKHTIHSLIDSGSTHTFLYLGVAKKLGCKLKATCLMDVSVDNRQIMSSLYECKGFK